jgi:electron transfer flavoprotein alpha subunit
MAVLLLAEVQDGALGEATARALTAAGAFGEPVHVLVAGQDVTAAAASAAELENVDKVLVADAPTLAHRLAEPLAALVTGLAGAYTTLLAPATASGKNVMPRVAALLDVMQVSEIMEIVAPDTFRRPIYAGNAIETVRSLDPKKVLTVRTASFAAATTGRGEPASIETVAGPDGFEFSRFKDEVITKSERPELGAAKVVISGGRGMQSAENFEKLIEPVADKLGAAMGASRAAVDAGFAPNDWQVGQTGKVVAPDLYIAVGISGAIQHLAGMKDSKVIVAINKDPEAPIFQVADYGLVDDLFKVLPELAEVLDKLRG